MKRFRLILYTYLYLLVYHWIDRIALICVCVRVYVRCRMIWFLIRQTRFTCDASAVIYWNRNCVQTHHLIQIVSSLIFMLVETNFSFASPADSAMWHNGEAWKLWWERQTVENKCLLCFCTVQLYTAVGLHIKLGEKKKLIKLRASWRQKWAECVADCVNMYTMANWQWMEKTVAKS